MNMPAWASSAGNTRGLIEAALRAHEAGGGEWSSAGNTRGLIEADENRPCVCHRRDGSSAGNTRGLIEAVIPPSSS